MLRLVIGNKNYSSWSLRAWLYLRESGIDFEEIQLHLDTEEFAEEVRRYTPAGRVPVLIDADVTVWDSMAILEHVREKFEGAVGWPAGPDARAMARSIAAEMHSGFAALRDELPQNLRAQTALSRSGLSDACRTDIARIESIWATSRSLHGAGGPWLFGPFSVADVVYAPVALRFATYDVALAGESRAFVDAICALPSVQEFIAAARAESARIPAVDAHFSR